MATDRKIQANALREFAGYLEEEAGDDLPEDVAAAVTSIVNLIKHRRAMHDWWEREAKGEKTIPSAEARKRLGF
ncbi:MAG TPA: hypothetical protein VNO21_28105 [Polyangiaceae bacterium]|nr:hypothetical protein [Polyangiaceae bacterium]